MRRKAALVAHQQIVKSIVVIREKKVMLDRDLAALYGVATKVLVQSVKRNIGRFPLDFMFQLTAREFRSLRSQFVTSKPRGGRRTSPYAFTEEGVAMLSSVLHSRRAVERLIDPQRDDEEASGGPVWTGDMVDRWPGTWWTPVDGQLTPSISLFLVAGRGCGRCGKREAFSKSCGKVRSSFPQDVSFHSPVLC